MPTLYDVSKKLDLHFSTKALCEIGLKVITKFRELSPGVEVQKVRVDLKTKKGQDFYWMVATYSDNFVPVMEGIIRESAHLAKPKSDDSKKKRKRIQKPEFKARPQ